MINLEYKKIFLKTYEGGLISLVTFPNVIVYHADFRNYVKIEIPLDKVCSPLRRNKDELKNIYIIVILPEISNYPHMNIALYGTWRIEQEE